MSYILFKLISNRCAICYADDIAIFCKSDNWPKLKEELGKDFIQIKDWFKMEKTCFLTFSCNSSNECPFEYLKIMTQEKVFIHSYWQKFEMGFQHKLYDKTKLHISRKSWKNFNRVRTTVSTFNALRDNPKKVPQINNVNSFTVFVQTNYYHVRNIHITLDIIKI